MAATLCVFRAEYEKEEEEEEQEERDGEATYNRNKNQELFVNKINNKKSQRRNETPFIISCQVIVSAQPHHSIINIGLFFFFFWNGPPNI